MPKRRFAAFRTWEARIESFIWAPKTTAVKNMAAIIRRGEIVIPRGSTRFELGDEVLAIVDPQAAKELAILLGRPQE